MEKIILAVIGTLFIIVGIAGLVLPVLPGWALIFVGFSLIAPKLAERLKRCVLRNFSKREIVYLEKWRRSGVHAGFTTRHFPMVLYKTDDLLDLAAQAQFQKLLGESKIALAHGMQPLSKFALLNQVHGDNVAVLDGENKYRDSGFYHLEETDGVITDQKGFALLAMSADCLPIFMKAPGWVGLVHAGWRGTKAQIAKKAYWLLKQRSSCRNSQIQIIFGPHISVGRYEVGPEFKDLFLNRALRERIGKLYFDLAGENRHQLRHAGALELNITDLGLCTVKENRDYYSFRKEKDAAGRMVSFILLQSQ